MHVGELKPLARRADQPVVPVGETAFLDQDGADRAGAVALTVGGLEVDCGESGHAWH